MLSPEIVEISQREEGLSLSLQELVNQGIVSRERLSVKKVLILKGHVLVKGDHGTPTPDSEDTQTPHQDVDSHVPPQDYFPDIVALHCSQKRRVFTGLGLKETVFPEMGRFIGERYTEEQVFSEAPITDQTRWIVLRALVSTDSNFAQRASDIFNLTTEMRCLFARTPFRRFLDELEKNYPEQTWAEWILQNFNAVRCQDHKRRAHGDYGERGDDRIAKDLVPHLVTQGAYTLIPWGGRPQTVVFDNHALAHGRVDMDPSSPFRRVSNCTPVNRSLFSWDADGKIVRKVKF